MHPQLEDKWRSPRVDTNGSDRIFVNSVRFQLNREAIYRASFSPARQTLALKTYPKAIEIGREDYGNGKIPHLVSEKSVHCPAGAVSESLTN
ncbi:hypothetical protein NDA07_01775 [Microcoleus vaginatus DQ-U2]|uniref:hypothetical protein n=1 Tax=Microcoleus vaginatus TaxID=119532 RepID=UPI001687A614|nr:hypothetical protein [Microcoleus sp. FACHB-DQ6]